MTLREVAEKLAVSEDTIRRLCLRGDLRSVAVGGVRRIPVSAITAYLEQGPEVDAPVFSLERRRGRRR